MAYEDEEPKARKRTGPKARGKTEATNRAVRAYLEEGLGWLRGYPESDGTSDRGESSEESQEVSIPWRAPSKGGSWKSLTVNRERLRTSFYTLRGAHRKFPHALGRVVGDLAAWANREEARLRQIQRAVHEGERLLNPAPTQSNGLDLRAELEWVAWGDTSEQARLREALRPWRPALAQMGSAVGALRARRLALEVLAGPRDLGFLDRLRPFLSSAAAYTVVTEPGEAADVLSGVAKTNLFKAGSVASLLVLGPPGTVRPVGVQVVQFLLTEPDPLVRDLVLVCLSPARARAWERWWVDAEACRKQARKLERALADAPAHPAPKKQPATANLAALLRESAHQAHQNQPRAISCKGLHETAQAGLKRLPKPSALKLLRCLALLHETDEPALTGVETILESGVGYLHELSERRRAGLLHGLAERLESSAGAALTPEQRIYFAKTVTGDLLEFDWNTHDIPWERHDVVLDAALLICSSPVADEWMEKFLKSWQIGGAFEGFAMEVRDPARLAAFVLQFGEVVSWDVATLAARFACERAPRSVGTVAVPPFAELRDTLGDLDNCKAWAAANQRDSRGISELKKLTRSGALREELRQAAAAEVPPHELTRFAALHARAKGVGSTNGGAPPESLPLDEDAWKALLHWIPEPLQAAALMFLAHSPANALPKVLSPTLVDPRALIAERTAIEGKLHTGELSAAKRSALEERFARLTQRLDRPITLEPDQVEQVRERLHSGAVRARFRRWLVLLQDAVLARLPAAAREAIDLAEDRQADIVIAGLVGLPARVRELGYRMLATRAGPKPWDLLDDPVNIAWRARAAEHGLDLTRWFSGAEFEVAPPPEGPTLRYALEDDPLEVMKMGLWFDTCLSPGDFNYFSTIANAADANKRLLVARDASGTVQVRCLFAITEQWHLLAFHVYAHERGDFVRETVKGILQSLCSAIGATPAPRGEVATLVAARWYDDGPHDLAEQLATLRPDGELTKRLESAAPANAFGIVTESLGASLVEVALELVLNTVAFHQSGARIASFAPLLTTLRLPPHFALNLIVRLAADGEDATRKVALGMIDRLCKGKSPGRLNLDVYEALSLSKAFRLLDQPGQALQVIRRRRETYEATAIQRETAWALTAMGLNDAAARIWHTLHGAGDAEATERLKSTGNLR